MSLRGLYGWEGERENSKVDFCGWLESKCCNLENWYWSVALVIYIKYIYIHKVLRVYMRVGLVSYNFHLSVYRTLMLSIVIFVIHIWPCWSFARNSIIYILYNIHTYLTLLFGHTLTVYIATHWPRFSFSLACKKNTRVMLYTYIAQKNCWLFESFFFLLYIYFFFCLHIID